MNNKTNSKNGTLKLSNRNSKSTLEVKYQLSYVTVSSRKAQLNTSTSSYHIEMQARGLNTPRSQLRAAVWGGNLHVQIYS